MKPKLGRIIKIENDNIKGSKQTDNNGKLITEYENADIDADADA